MGKQTTAIPPFIGLRVLDLSRTSSGAHASQLLADFGAEVILVEPPGGSPLRQGPAFPFLCRGKRSVVLDLHAPADVDAVRRLALGADVLLADAGSDDLEALGLGYGALGGRNSRLVHCVISGFGAQGPYAGAPGHEGLVMAKLGVFSAFRRMSETPERPAFVTAPFASYAAAQVALHGILAALHERETSGLGQQVRVSLALSFLALDTWAWIEHVLAKRWPDALKAYANYDELGRPLSHLTFRLLVCLTSDGHWLQFAATAPRLFAAKMRALGLDWMFDDPEWEGLPAFEDPAKGMELWIRMLTSARQKSGDEWARIFDEDPNVFAERFRAGADILQHPQLLHDGMSVVVEDAERGPVRQPGPLLKAGGTMAKLRSAPQLDENRSEILQRGWSCEASPIPPRASPAPRRLPLDGITIVEFAGMFAAPQGPALLSELGARVIKVEPPGGDAIRNLITIPETGGARVMQGKESICLDLSNPKGREIAKALAAKADVVVQGYRAGAMRRLGLDYASIRASNPDVIYVNAPGYGVDGPYGQRPAYAPSIAAPGGIPLTNLNLGAGDAGDPTMAEIQTLARRLSAAGTHTTAQADGVAAIGVATAIAFGVYARDCGAGGQELFTSMLNSSVHMMSAYAVNWPGSPEPPRVDGELRGFSAVYRIYDAAQGYVFLAVPFEDDWRRLAAALRDRIDLAGDARFASADDRQRNDAQLTNLLASVFRGRPASDWERDLLAQGVGCVQVTEESMESLLIDTPLGRESGYVVDVVDPTWDLTPRQAPLVGLSRSATQAKPGVLAGQHTDALLAEFGFGEQIQALRDEGVAS